MCSPSTGRESVKSRRSARTSSRRRPAQARAGVRGAETEVGTWQGTLAPYRRDSNFLANRVNWILTDSLLSEIHLFSYKDTRKLSKAPFINFLPITG